MTARNRRSRRGEIAPHVCSASGDVSRVTVDALRDAGLTTEADRLAKAVLSFKARALREPNESALALSVFGCCKLTKIAEQLSCPDL